MEFVNDPDAIGRWARKSRGGNSPKEIYFLPGGQKYWIFEGWTKGLLFTHEGGDLPVLSNAYSIEKSHMQIAFADGVSVYKKTSGREFALNEIGRHDDIGLPFVMDASVLGLWNVVDYVQSIRKFKADKPKSVNWPLKSICFYGDGTAVRAYDGEEWHEAWAKGFHLNLKNKTVSRYQRKTIGDTEYLFVEWKMGNYVYGGAKPGWYVFERLQYCQIFEDNG